MTRLPVLTLMLALLLLMASHPAGAHRPYFTQVEPVVLPNGQPGEMRLLRGDGIFLADPARILVLDREGRLLARSHHSTTMALLCDRGRQSCRGYDGFSVLTPDPASFRLGDAVPGLTDAERSGLWAFEAGTESWGFAVRGASLARTVRGEVALALETPRALALLVALGAIAAMLIPAGMLRAEDGARPPSWLRAIGTLLRLAGLAVILLVSVYTVALIGLTSIAWLAGLGSGAALVLFWRSRRWRRRAIPPLAT